MNSICFSLKRLCFVGFISVFSVSTLFGQSVNREKAKQLETLATHASGVLSDIPEEIRALRSGPVTQRVIISDDGFLTISRRFYYKPFSGAATEKLVKATSMKKFALADLKDKQSFRYELNVHANTIKLFDNDCGWPLGFPSTADAKRAFSLLASLIASAPSAPPSSPFSCSAAAAQAGYRYLVVGFRCEEVAEAVRLLSISEPSLRLMCYLTKRSPQETEELFLESMNRLPLFLFDLSALDSCSFFTQSIPGNTAFLPCSIGPAMLQSVYSNEKEGFEAFLHSSPYVGIRFQSMPDLPPPVAILCRACDEHKIRKTAHSLKMHVKEAHWYLDSELNGTDGLPRGAVSSWVAGMNNNSYDILRYCLFHKELTPTLFLYTLYPEFPSLQKLLKMKSRYHKDLTIEEMICRTSHALESLAKTLPEFHERVLRLALATHELGSPFGDDADIGYNSWPLVLSVAERVGMTEQEKRAVQALVEEPSATVPRKSEKKKTDTLFFALVQESRTANEIGICLQEWLRLKASFYEILSSQGKPPSSRQGIAQTIKSLRERYSSLLPFGVPRGALFAAGPLKTQPLYSCYLWEVRDPQHRDGPSLKRRREKFERMIVEGGKTSWKGRFWDWLNKELQEEPILSNTYLNDSERNAILARFEDGMLAAPRLPQKNNEVETIFVIDDCGRMYIGLQDDEEHGSEVVFNHASLMGGRPAASAGTLIFREGNVVGITAHSGQYRCGPNELSAALSVLEKMGVSLDQVEVPNYIPIQ